MTENHTNDSEKRIVINFADTADLNIESLDVGVANGIIAFDITGTISNVPADRLDDLRNKELTPAELVFAVTDAA